METAKILSEMIYKYGKLLPERQICFLSNCLIDLLYEEHKKIEQRIIQQSNALLGHFDRKFYYEASTSFTTVEKYLYLLIPLLEEIEKTEVSEEWQSFGENENVTMDILKICTALDCDISDIVEIDVQR